MGEAGRMDCRALAEEESFEEAGRIAKLFEFSPRQVPEGLVANYTLG
jgi:hypothetical protein